MSDTKAAAMNTPPHALERMPNLIGQYKTQNAGCHVNPLPAEAPQICSQANEGSPSGGRDFYQG